MALMAMLAAKANPCNQGNWALDMHPIVIDLATTQTIMPFKSDLIDPESCRIGLPNIGKSHIKAKGAIAWTIQANDGCQVQITDSNA